MTASEMINGPGLVSGPASFEALSAADCYSGEKKLTALADAITLAKACGVPVTGGVAMDTLYAPGRVLAHDIVSPLPLPPFDQSAMDGFAVHLPETGVPAGSQFSLIGRLAAGGDSSTLPSVGKRDAYRIYTGAPLPTGANAVIMQEHCSQVGDGITINLPLEIGDNIRQAGEDIKQGHLVIAAGEMLDARHVAVLSAMGFSKVMVRRKLRVGIFTTGSELAQPGVPLRPGQIYDANKAMLVAALKRPGLEIEDYGSIGDDLGAITTKLEQCMTAVDLILTTGSAGGSDTDLLFKAVAKAGGKAKLLKLALKPGKPCIMGRIGQAAFLGLPGNPVAALVSFLMFGEPMIGGLLGATEIGPAFINVRSANWYRRSPGKTEFAPARIVADADGLPEVEIVGRGGSARYLPLLMADGLCRIAAELGHVEKGTILSFLPFKSLSWT